MPNDNDSDRGRAVPPVPRDFVEIPTPCPIDGLSGAPRFVALYPMHEERFAVNEGQAVYSRDGDEAPTARWLHDALAQNGAAANGGPAAVVVDLSTRRAWRAPIEQAIGFVIKMRSA